MTDAAQQVDLMECKDCACLNLRMASRAITQMYDRALQPHGLRATQFQVLVPIGNLGPVTINDLAERMVMDRTTLSRDLGPLAKRGWLKIQPGEDRRTRIVELTPRGRRLVQEAFHDWHKAQSKVVEALGPTEFGGLLRKLKAAVRVAKSPPR